MEEQYQNDFPDDMEAWSYEQELENQWWEEQEKRQQSENE